MGLNQQISGSSKNGAESFGLSQSTVSKAFIMIPNYTS